MAELPDQETLQALLRYEPDTGKLFWKERPLEMFDGEEWRQKKWNGRHAGKPALKARHTGGYLYGNLFNQKVRAHRVIWKLMTGEEVAFIDHMNGVRDDNRWKNLRAVTKQENCQNQRMNRRNTSGVMGVCWNATNSQWHVRIAKQHVGYFDDFQEAVVARKAAEAAHGYHPNHGRTV